MQRYTKLERRWLVSALLVLAVLAVYLPVFRLGFLTYDDDYYVTRNPPVAAGLTAAGTRWAFTQFHSANWHPLTWLSHMLDCQIYGLNAAGHHATSLLFHAANTILLFLWLRSLTGAFWRSAFVAALFGLHPLHVESVAWVAERKDVLCAFFGLLSLWAYTRYAQEQEVSTQGSAVSSSAGQAMGHGPQSTKPASRITHYASRFTFHASSFYILSLVLFTCGLLSKPMLVTWPFVMLLLDYWPLGRLSQSAVHGPQSTAGAPPPGVRSARKSQIVSRLLVEKLPFFLISAASCAVTLAAQKTGGAVATLASMPLGARILNALDSYLRYVEKLLWPADLAVIYPFATPPGPELVLAGLVIVSATFLAVWQRQRRPYLLVGWAWFAGMLVPVIGLVQVGNQAFADRYTYLPAIGLFIALAWVAADLADAWSLPRRLALAIPAAIALLACGLVGHNQLRYWQSSDSLFRHALDVTHDNFVAWSGLGYYLAEQGRAREAEACYRAAVEINPAFAEAWNGLGYALAGQRKYDDAISSYETAVRLAPDHVTARDNLATALASCGRIEEAKEQCRAAMQVDPQAAAPHNNLAALLARQGQWDKAITEYKLALSRDPGLSEARCGLAGALAQQGKSEEAVRELSDLLNAQPSYGPARLQLGVILAREHQTDKAIAEFSELLRANPDDSAAHYHLALALSAQGKAKEALAHYRAALKAAPDFAEALNNLAWMLATSPDPQLRNGAEAVDLAERACRITENRQAHMLGTLAASFAEAGRFPEAIAAAEQAKTLAEQAHDTETATANTKLLALYRSGKPYRDQP
jgi:protein O-mannosyl-transferase